MIRIRIVLKLLLLLGVCSLEAKTPPIQELLSSNPPSLVDSNGINLATGTYQGIATDIPGEDSRLPPLQRAWNGKRWVFNHSASLTIVDYNNKPTRIQVEHPFGLTIEYQQVDSTHYRPRKIIENRRSLPFNPTRLKQYSLKYDRAHKTFIEKHPSGEQRAFAKQGSAYRLKEITRSDGYLLHYRYNHQGRLAKIKTKTPSHDRVISWIKFHYLSPHSADCVVTSSEGHHIIYEYYKPDFGKRGTSQENLKLLHNVRIKAKGAISYDYQQLANSSLNLIKTIREVGKPTISFNYEGDGSIATVSLSPEVFSEYAFTQEQDERVTQVIDPQGNLKRYTIANNNRLTSIDHILPDNQLYRRIKYAWDEALSSKRLLDGRGNILGKHYFHYDKRGLLTKSVLKGNLTGEPGSWDKFSTHYTYEDTWPYRLKKISQDNGLKVRFKYHEHTNRPTSRLIYANGELVNRQFYSYDQFGNPISTTVDDGQSSTSQDLAGVTERHITSIQPRLQLPGFGLPEEIEEGYLDPSTHHLTRLKKTVNTYSPEGHLIAEEVFDGLDQAAGSVNYHYDDLGRLADTQQGEARRIMTYDDQSRVTLITNDRADGYVRYEYDDQNRLVYQENREEGDRFQAKTIDYDGIGLVVSTRDIFDNPISYQYDALGRIIEIALPDTIDANDGIHRPARKQSYNEFDLPITYTDEEGYVTELSYTLRGQIASIFFADGTTEHHRYRPDGSEIETIEKDGKRHLFIKDALGRTLQSTLLSQNGDLLSQQNFEFTGLRPTEIRDLQGITRSFKYDAAGRLEEVFEDYGADSFQAEFLYGEAGDLVGTKVWHDYRSKDFTVTSWNKNDQWLSITDDKGKAIQSLPLTSLKNAQAIVSEKEEIVHSEVNYSHFNEMGQNVLQTKLTTNSGTTVITTYDAHGREHFVEILDPFSQPLRKVECRYDQRGIKSFERHYANGEPVYTRRQGFGANGRLEWESEEGPGIKDKTTHYRYDSHGKVQQIIKPDGVSLFKEYDDAGRLARIKSSDQTVHYEYVYGLGNEPEAVIDHVHGYMSQRELDAKGRITKEQLGNDLEISFTYNRAGQPTEVRLPDKSRILYGYRGPQLERIERLDRKLKTQYEYVYEDFDAWGRPIRTKMIKGLGKNKFEWDAQGRCRKQSNDYFTEEILDDTEIKTRDFLGREHHHYQFDALNQLSLENGKKRHYDSLGVPKTSHDYQEDPNGNLVLKQGPKDEEHFTYDALDRLIRYERPEAIAATYTYDAWDRRIEKIVWEWNTKKGKWTKQTTHRYLYDHQKEIGCVNEAGEFIELRILGTSRGAEIGGAIAIEINGKPYAPIHDHRGCLRTLVGCKKHNAVETYRYTAFGEESLFDKEGKPIDHPLSPWRFSSKRVDEESGLVLFGKRYYDPTLARWITPDPIGSLDAPSPYTFVRNNPVFLNDAFGLFSIKESLQSLVCTGANLAWDLISGIITLSEKISEKMAVIDQIGQEIEDLAHQLIGETLFYLAGYYVEENSFGCVGTGEINDQVRVTYINGILNNLNRCLDAAQLISETHGGINVHFLHSASCGFTWDVIHAILRKGGYSLSQARLLADLWREMIDEMGGPSNGGTIYHYAHSIGGTDTLLAKEFLTPEEREMIHVVTFGSPTLIPEQGFASVLNVVSYRDGVPYFDPHGYLKGMLSLQPNIIFIGDLLGVPFIDHCFGGPSYRSALDHFGAEFLEFYGTF